VFQVRYNNLYETHRITFVKMEIFNRKLNHYDNLENWGMLPFNENVDIAVTSTFFLPRLKTELQCQLSMYSIW
jgi:hypothetical protein